MPTKSKRATSPVAELEEREPADEVPEPNDPPAKKKKSKRGDVTTAAEAAPPKKRKTKKTVDEMPADDNNVDDEDAAPEADEETTEIDWEALNEWVKEFRSSNRRLPSAAELSENCGFDAALAKKVYKKIKDKADAATKKKKAKQIRGYAQLAKDAGYCMTTDVNARMDKGTDMMHPLVSMADAARLATFVPCTPDAVSVSQEEFEQHIEIMNTTLAQGVAREITVNVDPIFRHCMNSAAKLQLALGGTRINPSTMMHVLKPMVSNLAFPSVLSPPGVVKFTKDEAAPMRKDFEKGDKGLDAWKKAVAKFNKRVKAGDRGMAILEFDPADADEAALAKDNSADAKANAKAYNAEVTRIKGEKEARKASRQASAAPKAN
tara:strand:- start:1798 stop:2931 length:1134 start_codon:yes stop_codon:yes gene_type:complete